MGHEGFIHGLEFLSSPLAEPFAIFALVDIVEECFASSVERVTVDGDTHIIGFNLEVKRTYRLAEWSGSRSSHNADFYLSD